MQWPCEPSKSFLGKSRQRDSQIEPEGARERAREGQIMSEKARESQTEPEPKRVTESLFGSNRISLSVSLSLWFRYGAEENDMYFIQL